MKKYTLFLALFALLFASQTVEAQSQNVYRYSYEVDSLVAGTSIAQEVPATLLSLWTLGGSFNVTNLGSLPDDFSVTVYGTSDPDAPATVGFSGTWQAIKQIAIIGLAAGATSYQHFRAANEMFYIGHTRIMIVFSAPGEEPGSLSANLVLKKE